MATRTYYRTEYTMPNGKRGSYQTYALTEYHEHLRNAAKEARTMLCDPNVNWPFGVFAEVIAEKK